MKAALVVDDAEVKAARSESAGGGSCLRGRGHREVCFHGGERCKRQR